MTGWFYLIVVPGFNLRVSLGVSRSQSTCARVGGVEQRDGHSCHPLFDLRKIDGGCLAASSRGRVRSLGSLRRL
ncbi:hypothetical protein F5Y10DRAFT_229383 [Nemania abortiva]|nr:hypothetical protein F5Y10DRAFT_229383 [Nemania abortiva]